jgi:serine/threonine protein kinase
MSPTLALDSAAMAVRNLSTVFLESLAKSHLLSEAELAECRLRFVEGRRGPVACATDLVERGLLTDWQALQLLSGRAGFLLGPYVLLERVGKGGVAVVYKARHRGMGHTVALKVFSQHLLRHQVAASRFRRETRVAVMVNHRHVVTGYGSKCFGGKGVLIMEYVNGEDLGRWQKRCGVLPVDWCCEAARQAALGLEHIRQRGLVHRDIKPSNLLAVAASPREMPLVKVADLGAAALDLAIAENQGATPLTTINQFLGTPNYVAPEQAMNIRDADHRSDIFSLGCSLFKLLTGELPWKGVSVTDRLVARTREDALPARRFRAELPGELEAVVARMLARDPALRYSTAAEAAVALAPWSMQAPGRCAAAPPIASLNGQSAAPGPRLPIASQRRVSSGARWHLQRLAAAGQSEFYPLDERQCVIVGRARDCDIQVRDSQASRHHCRLTFGGSAWVIDDLGSNNGTIVNGGPVATAELKDGDRIQLGETVLWLMGIDAHPREA